MGNPKGFIEHTRKESGYRPVEERVLDYNDVMISLDEKDIRIQASRCMDCGVPFCHSIGCPVNNLIPEWNDLVYMGKWKEAFERLAATNTLPEITGRICPAPCETSCTLSINSAPVTIKQIELAIIEYAFEHAWVSGDLPSRETGKKIAIIGSGPAGLAAAISLRQKGHSVTVFERSHEIGGILRYGIPDFKLEKWVIDRRIKIMKRTGIKFETGVDIGDDISASYLLKTFEVILITTGAGHPRNLSVPGRELNGIHFAMDYLTASNKYVAAKSGNPPDISAEDKNVLVIGGGDTGSNCIGTANRQGAKKVYQFEILPKPREWTAFWNPDWPDWPNILRTSSSQKEGSDRKWAIQTKSFSGNKGKIQKAHFIEIEWEKDEAGKYCIQEIEGSDFELDVDLILLAMGFVHVEHNRFLEDLKIDYDERGNIATNADYSTNVKNVFAAGDSGTGASLAVRAIDHGQKAADSIDKHLQNH